MSVNTVQVVTAGLYVEDVCELGEVFCLERAADERWATEAAGAKADLIERNNVGLNIEPGWEDGHWILCLCI